MRLAILVAISFIVSSGQGFGHGGGLNSEGCHNNRKTGDYHCHRGSASRSNVQQPPVSRPKSDGSFGSPSMPYDRDLYDFRSYPPMSSRGFYSQELCNTNIDHVVSLKDAHESGASQWNSVMRSQFANDRLNHVSACSSVNSSKGSSTPSDFRRKSSDGQGLDYPIVPWCAYVGIYYQVKLKYALSFNNNNPSVFEQCGLMIR
jgi:hypothetical protein